MPPVAGLESGGPDTGSSARRWNWPSACPAGQAAAGGPHPGREIGQPAAGAVTGPRLRRGRSGGAIVADPQPQQPLTGGGLDRARRCGAVPQDVGDRLPQHRDPQPLPHHRRPGQPAVERLQRGGQRSSQVSPYTSKPISAVTAAHQNAYGTFLSAGTVSNGSVKDSTD